MSKKIRCKFKCDRVTKVASSHYNPETGNTEPRLLYGADLTPVYGGSEENKAFFDATPCGRFEVQSITPDFFEPGKDYFLDVTLAE